MCLLNLTRVELESIHIYRKYKIGYTSNCLGDGSHYSCQTFTSVNICTIDSEAGPGSGCKHSSTDWIEAWGHAHQQLTKCCMNWGIHFQRGSSAIHINIHWPQWEYTNGNLKKVLSIQIGIQLIWKTLALQKSLKSPLFAAPFCFLQLLPATGSILKSCTATCMQIINGLQTRLVYNIWFNLWSTFQFRMMHATANAMLAYTLNPILPLQYTKLLHLSGEFRLTKWFLYSTVIFTCREKTEMVWFITQY